MDSVVHSALEEISCEAANGLHLRDLWPKLNPCLASRGLPLCPNVKRAVWENLAEIPGLKLEACDYASCPNATEELMKCDVEVCEKLNVKIVAPEAMRKSFLGIYEMEASESSLSDTQRLILERLAVARANGIAQSELAKELRIAANNLFYQLKRLEIQGLIVRHPTVIRKKQASSSREQNNGSIVATNMLYLYRYGKHLGCQQRLEITKEDKSLDGQGAICDKLENAQGKVLVVSDLKRDLGYRGTSGHRAWRNICHRLKEAQVVEECYTLINKKEANCLRLLRSFTPTHFEPKPLGRVRGDNDEEQSINCSKRGQITEQLVELPIFRQIYDMIDAAGSEGLTNTELENHNRGEVYRVWTARNFNRESSYMAPNEKETVPPEVNDVLDLHENLSQPMQVVDDSTSLMNIRGINESENDPAGITEASNGTSMDDEGSGVLLLKCNTQNSVLELCEGAPAEELTAGSKSIAKNNLLETCSPAVVVPPRRGSYLKYPRLTMAATSSQREQRILKMLQEEKFLIKPELHRRLESLEKKKNTMMDRKTLERSLNKLQKEGHCKCIHVSVPVVTNCGRSRTTEVVLHPSVYSVSPELLAQIHEKMRSFEIHVRQQSYIRQKKGESVPMLHNVQRIPNSLRLDVQSERAEVMRANGFVLAKMVRTKLLHIFLWGWIRSSPGWNDGLSSNNHSYDLKNPHSSCKLFELDLAIRSMPLELFLQVVGSAQKFDDMVEKCRSGLLLCDLPMEEYKGLMDTRATGRLSWLIDILRRLKLIRLVSKGHAEDGASSPHTTLTHALELKPYIEEPVSAGASSGLIYPDLRPQVRHDFVLSSRKAVDEYWNTLEYCFAAAKSRAALLAFPGSAVHEVFHSRSWASVRVMTADQRVELLKRIAKDDPNKRLSFGDCEKIANDLNLTLEQVLRVYYDKRKLRLTRFQRGSDAEGQELQTVKGKRIISSRKRKRYPDRMSSKLAKASMADGQSSGEAVGPPLDSDTQFMEEQNCVLTTSEDYDCQLRRYHAGEEIEGSEVLKLTEEDRQASTFIHKQALSRLKSARQRKFSWTEEADRRLVIEYARRRAALGAKFHRVDWASISNLPAPPGACKRRMASLNSYIPFRKAVMKLCNMLAEHYAKYLETIQERVLNHGGPGKMVTDTASEEEDISCSPAVMSGEWVNFDEIIIKEALDDVLRYKRMAKLEAVQNTLSDPENNEDDDFEGCGGGAKASSRRSSSQQLPRKYLKLLNKGASVSRRMHESVAIANAAELFKLIFLSKSTAPEVPALLAETLRRYSEHDLFAAFSYLREKKIMIGGSCNNRVDLSQHFVHSISLSTFPADTGKRAANFATWLHEREKDLMEEGVDVPSNLQCGEVITLCALVSSGELSITPCLPDEGVGEAEDNRTSKRKCDSSELDGGEISKRSKTSFAGEGEIISRREKGFPGIKLRLHRESISRLLAIGSFTDGDMYPASIFLGKDQNKTLSRLDVNSGSMHSEVAEYVREILDSGRMIHPALDVNESPWEAMTSYAEFVMSSCSYEVKCSFLHPHLFKSLYSAIQKSGDNGLSMKEIRKVLNIKDDKTLEVMIEVLEAFGRALKVNAYDSIHVVDSLYRSKYFLTSVHDPADTVSALENEINWNADEVHRVTILNLPEDVADPPTEISNKDKINSYQHSEVASPKMTRFENLELHSANTKMCRPLLPWMNGDGTINELVYKGLIRRVLAIVMQYPGILEEDIINEMHGLNPQPFLLV
ncbi:UNVERIFIED_CONTAM: hypothetical protein Scaly_1846900 [Sesamum calycinum]|uniref:B-block binding subunit of TFIIIC n=1 Tax=Sesamum calycinum TaxID=2727403 RepID=A0AAW2NFV4_9LAMI